MLRMGSSTAMTINITSPPINSNISGCSSATRVVTMRSTSAC